MTERSNSTADFDSAIGQETQIGEHLPLYLQLSNGDAIEIFIPVADKLKGDIGKYFPHASNLNETLMSEVEVYSFIDSVVNYLDLVLLVTPEARDQYRKMLDNDGGNVSFVKDGFAYSYTKSQERVDFSRFTADTAGNVLIQGFEAEDGTIEAVTTILQDADLEKIKSAVVIAQTPSLVDFIREIVSDLNPVSPNF